MNDNEQVAITWIVRAIQAHRRVFYSCWLAVFALAVLLAWLMSPVYRAELVLMPADADSSKDLMSSVASQFGGLASLAGIGVNRNDDLQENLALLNSKRFTANFILENNLLPIMYGDNWDHERGTWKEGQERDMWEILDLFEKNVRTVSFDPVTGIVLLRIDWRDGNIAAQWANRMADELNTLTRDRAIREANESIEYLHQEARKTNLVGMEQSVYRLIETQISKIMMANVRKEYAFRIIDPAIPPAIDAPIRPNRPLILSIGLVLGLLAGGFLAVLLEVFRSDN